VQNKIEQHQISRALRPPFLWFWRARTLEFESGETFLTDVQVAFIRSIWRKTDPSLRALFADDIREQKTKLLAVIGSSVYAAGQAGAGVSALIWTLEQNPGEDHWTDATRAAWLETYNLLSQTIMQAVHPQAA
jgi:hypothetical protein